MSRGQRRAACVCGQRVATVERAGKVVVLAHLVPSHERRCEFSYLAWPAPRRERVGGRR